MPGGRAVIWPPSGCPRHPGADTPHHSWRMRRDGGQLCRYGRPPSKPGQSRWITLRHICVLTGSSMITDVYSSGAGHLCPYGGDVGKHRYLITISGGLSETGREAFGDFRIELNGTNTALIADLAQSGLSGVLNRVQALDLELVELTRLTD